MELGDLKIQVDSPCEFQCFGHDGVARPKMFVPLTSDVVGGDDAEDEGTDEARQE